jgi:hypothetical protein
MLQIEKLWRVTRIILPSFMWPVAYISKAANSRAPVTSVFVLIACNCFAKRYPLSVPLGRFQGVNLARFSSIEITAEISRGKRSPLTICGAF